MGIGLSEPCRHAGIGELVMLKSCWSVVNRLDSCTKRAGFKDMKKEEGNGGSLQPRCRDADGKVSGSEACTSEGSRGGSRGSLGERSFKVNVLREVREPRESSSLITSTG